MSTVLSCSTNSSAVNWLFYRYNNLTASPCYLYKGMPSPGDYCADLSRFTVTPRSSNPTSYDLVISLARLADGGIYVCEESGGQKAAALLGVMYESNFIIRAARCDNATRASPYVLLLFLSFFLFIKHEISAVSRPIAAKLCHMIGNGCNFKD